MIITSRKIVQQGVRVLSDTHVPLTIEFFQSDADERTSFRPVNLFAQLNDGDRLCVEIGVSQVSHSIVSIVLHETTGLFDSFDCERGFDDSQIEILIGMPAIDLALWSKYFEGQYYADTIIELQCSPCLSVSNEDLILMFDQSVKPKKIYKNGEVNFLINKNSQICGLIVRNLAKEVIAQLST